MPQCVALARSYPTFHSEIANKKEYSPKMKRGKQSKNSSNANEDRQKKSRLEEFSNFRWILKLGFARRSSLVLTRSHRTSKNLQKEVSDIGCFAELAHNYFDVRMIWGHLDSLLRCHFPLEHYQGLRGSQLLSIIHGAERTRAIISRVPDKKQIILAFAGTAYIEQALYNLDIRKTEHISICRGQEGSDVLGNVHRGFWKLYLGIRSYAFGALETSLRESSSIEEVVITGHSLGAALACYFVLDLIDILVQTASSVDKQVFTIKYVGFGSPRVGDEGFSKKYAIYVDKYRTRFGESNFIGLSVRNHNDGK